MFLRMKSIAVCGLLCCLCVNVRGTSDDPQPFPDASRAPVALPAVPVQELAARLKESLLKTLPEALVFETSRSWGHQARIPSLQGVKPIHVMRNHGDWEKARVVTWQLPKYLWVRVVDLHSPDDNRIAFTMHMAMPATVELDQQIWQNGIPIYSGRVRARFHLTADVTIDATLAPVAKESPTPHREASFQIARATFSCNDFVTENVNGVGGEIARLTGAQRKFKAWQPPVLREFQELLLTAVQTASATSELRASLSQVVAQSLATRSAILQAKAAAQRWPLPDSTPPVVAPAPAVPIFCFGEVTIPIPLWTEHSHAAAWDAAIHPDHADHSEHWDLSAHSIHYEHSTHLGHSSDSGAARHAEPEHKR